MKKRRFFVAVAALVLLATACSKEKDEIVSNDPIIPPVPAGVINGLFSVSPTQQVYFSKGNLQYKSGTGWRFAEHQYDYKGAWNTSDWVDLFGWGTWTGSTPNPTNTSITDIDYSFDSTDFDQTLHGSDAWRTLSMEEWDYLFNSRASCATVNGTSNARYIFATINTDSIILYGLILFPDGVTIASDEATSWGTINGTSPFEDTRCTVAQWMALEARGCVFLPGAGCRYGTSPYIIEGVGSYWSSTSFDAGYGYSSYAYSLGFGLGNVGLGGGNRSSGLSVRLVQNNN